MQYFRDINNKVFAYDDNVKSNEIPSNLTKITFDEYESFKVFGCFDKTRDAITAELRLREAKEKFTKTLQDFNNAVLNYLDTICKSKGFTGDDKTRPYRAIANYVGYDNVFRDEAEKLGAWIALVFQKAESIEKDVLEGKRELPTIEEVLEELPKYE